MIGIHAFFLWRVRDQIARGDPDFTVFYTAGKMLRDGQGAELYSSRAQLAAQMQFARNSDIRSGPLPYIHPPFEALFFLPFTYLPYPRAFAAWNLINLAILGGVGILLRQSLWSLQAIPVWQMVLLSLAFFPIFANFHQGQDAILLLLMVTLSFRALRRDADFLAGCWLGLGIFKYHFIFPLALILTFWRGRKFLLGFAAVSSAALLISLALVGWHGALRYPVYAWRVVSEPVFGGIPPRQLPSLFGLFAGWGVSQKFLLAMQIAVAVSSIALVIMVAALRRFAQSRRWSGLCVSAAVIAALLVGYSTNTYDLSLLVLPLAVIANWQLEGVPVSHRLLWPAVPLFASPLWFFLWMRWERINLMGLFLLWWLFAVVAEIRRMSRLNAALSSEVPLIANA
jgi:Glycosyltransferase family 87